MKKNSVIGFALIGLILLLFSWYNTKQFEEQQKERLKQDSIAAVAALSNIPQDTNSVKDIIPVMDSSISTEEIPLYQSEMLNLASQTDVEYYTLENDKIKITLTSKGAQPYEVLIKKYYTYDSTALYLMPKSTSKLDIELNASQWINTAELNFKKVALTDSSLTLRLYFADQSYIESTYSLAQGSYMVDYNLAFVGMENILDRSTNYFILNWVMDLPRLEKGYTNEKNYSTIAYKFTGSDDVKTLGLRKDSNKESFSASINWVGFQQQFFSAIMVAPNNFISGNLALAFYKEEDPNHKLMNCSSEMHVELDTKSSNFSVPLKFYYGPNHYPTLKSYDQGFEKIIPLGGWLIGSINRYFIIPCFNWLSKYFASYGLIILILTLLIKLIISPLTFKSYASSAKMKVMKPEIDKINAKYPRKEDAMKKQQATMALYKKTGISMFGGCLPMLLQFPILFAMFRFFPASFELRQQSFLWATDLSAYDSILTLPFKIPMYGDHISLFALLMGVSMFFYSKMTMGQTPDNQQMAGMKFMQVWFMPIFMIVLCNNFSAGLSYYYMLSNVLTIIQNWVIRKWFVDEKKLYEKLKAKADSKDPVQKSKFQQRLDSAYKAQQEQLKKR